MRKIMDIEFQNVENLYDKMPVAIEIIAGVVICLILYFGVLVVKQIYSKTKSKKDDSPVILHGLVDGKMPRIIDQNPNNSGSITLKRSVNESGIAFSYSFWIYIDGKTWSSYTNKWKHIFHKGTKMTNEKNNEPHIICPIQCPGLWIHPGKNAMRLYINTFNTNREYVEIDNMPIKKWIHIAYCQSNFLSTVYVNGRLKASHVLQTLPRQNYYNLHLFQEGGFDGYMSSMQYFNYILHPSSISSIALKGPNVRKSTKDTKTDDDKEFERSHIPYLSNRWWVHDLTIN